MKMDRFMLLALASLLWVGQVSGQETASSADAPSSDPLAIKIGTRIDYQREYLDGDAAKDNCGFKGKYLFFDVDADISSHLSFSYRQRINEINHDNSFFDATDCLRLTYKFNSRWNVSAGKMPIYIGSWEYERNPMYIYNFSEWVNHLSCFKFAATVGFNPTPNDRLIAQFSESPFNDKNDLYAYHLAWYGRHGLLNTIYTANMLENRPGHFLYLLCLGHQFNIGNVRLELDYINRASGHHAFFFKDCSLIGELSYEPTKHWNLIAKGAYDVNHTNDPSDTLLEAGTELTNLTAGAECFPLKDGNKDLRIFATCGYAFGTNTHPEALVKDKQLLFSIGTQFYVNLVDVARKIWNKTKK